MRTSIVIVVAALSVTPALRAQDTEAAVRRAVHAYDAAWARRDTAMVRLVLAPAYRYEAGGTSYDRTQTIAFLALPAYAPSTSTRDSIAVELHDSTAVVHSILHTSGTMRGKSFTEDQRCTLGLVEHGVWLVESERCEKIAPPAPVKTRGRGR